MPFQPPQGRASDILGDFGWQQGSGVRFLQAVPPGINAMLQREGAEVEAGSGKDDSWSAGRIFLNSDPVMKYGCLHEPLQVMASRGRINQGDGMLDLIQGQTLNDPRQAQAVIAVKVCQANDADLPGLNPGQGHLALGALAWVEKNTFPVPAQKKTNVISMYCGDLTSSSQYGELSFGHTRLWTKSFYVSRSLFDARNEILSQVLPATYSGVLLYKETNPSYGQLQRQPPRDEEGNN